MTGTLPVVQLGELVRKDLRLEARTGEALLVTLPFAAVALMLLPLAVGAEMPLLEQVGQGLYWLVVLLFGALVTLRHSSVEGPAQQTLLALCGVDPVVRVAARTCANLVLLLAVEVLLAPVAIALYNPYLSGWPWLLGMLPLVATGLAALGALADGLVGGLGERVTLGPLLAVPLSLPLLLGATQVSQAARYGRSPWPWLLLVITVDLVLLMAAAWTAGSLEEAS